MEWAMLAKLIVEAGYEAGMTIARNWENKQKVTAEELDKLDRLAANTPRSKMLEALAASNINVDDPKAVALLALVP